jgi:allophanate hydrolase subunit 1
VIDSPLGWLIIGDSQQKLFRAVNDKVWADGWGKEARKRVVTVKAD